MFNILFDWIANLIDGVKNLITFISDSMTVFNNWGVFIPNFLTVFLVIGLVLTIILVILKRANK